MTAGPRRGPLGASAGGVLAIVLGRDVEDAAAAKKNRCPRVDRGREPFKPGKCCSERCCLALGRKGRKTSVCAPKRASQCCPVIFGGGYCDKPNYRKCCRPTAKSKDGFCCPQAGSACCEANSVQAKDYCCPPGSECFDGLKGCRATPTNGIGATATVEPEAAGRKAG